MSATMLRRVSGVKRLHERGMITGGLQVDGNDIQYMLGLLGGHLASF